MLSVYFIQDPLGDVSDAEIGCTITLIDIQPSTLLFANPCAMVPPAFFFFVLAVRKEGGSVANDLNVTSIASPGFDSGRVRILRVFGCVPFWRVRMSRGWKEMLPVNFLGDT